MFKKTAFTVLTCIGLASASLSAHAYSTFSGLDVDGSAGTRASFTNANVAQANFLSFLQGVGTETFESLNGSTPFNLSFPGAGTATLSGSASIVTQGPGTEGNGRYPSSGLNFLQTDSTSFMVTFSSSVAAFGFFGMDIGEFGGDLWLRVNQVGGGFLDFDVPNALAGQDGSSLYFGLIAANAAEEFLSIEFFDTNPAGGDVFAFDDMTIGSLEQVCQQGCTVPEPESSALLGLGLLGLLGTQLRRKRA